MHFAVDIWDQLESSMALSISFQGQVDISIKSIFTSLLQKLSGSPKITQFACESNLNEL